MSRTLPEWTWGRPSAAEGSVMVGPPMARAARWRGEPVGLTAPGCPVTTIVGRCITPPGGRPAGSTEAPPKRRITIPGCMGEPATIPTAPTRPVDEGEGRVPAVATGRSWRRRRRPSTLRTFLVLSGVYLAAVVALGAWMASRNGGTFTYPLDDPYIHLALAENLVHHGSWGVTPGVFESASSSPAWTLLL